MNMSVSANEQTRSVTLREVLSIISGAPLLGPHTTAQVRKLAALMVGEQTQVPMSEGQYQVFTMLAAPMLFRQVAEQCPEVQELQKGRVCLEQPPGVDGVEWLASLTTQLVDAGIDLDRQVTVTCLNLLHEMNAILDQNRRLALWGLNAWTDAWQAAGRLWRFRAT